MPYDDEWFARCRKETEQRLKRLTTLDQEIKQAERLEARHALQHRKTQQTRLNRYLSERWQEKAAAGAAINAQTRLRAAVGHQVPASSKQQIESHNKGRYIRPGSQPQAEHVRVSSTEHLKPWVMQEEEARAAPVSCPLKAPSSTTATSSPFIFIHETKQDNDVMTELTFGEFQAGCTKQLHDTSSDINTSSLGGIYEDPPTPAVYHVQHYTVLSQHPHSGPVLSGLLSAPLTAIGSTQAPAPGLTRHASGLPETPAHSVPQTFLVPLAPAIGVEEAGLAQGLPVQVRVSTFTPQKVNEAEQVPRTTGCLACLPFLSHKTR